MSRQKFRCTFSVKTATREWTQVVNVEDEPTPIDAKLKARKVIKWMFPASVVRFRRCVVVGGAR